MPEVLIVVHGLAYGVRQWEHCMWGNPQQGVDGRASHALRVSALYSNPCLFLAGGGVVDKSDISVAQRTKELILERASEMYDCSFEERTCSGNTLRDRLLLDTSATNTQKELENAFKVCKEKSIPKLILVSSPTHIARCLQEALCLKQQYNDCSLTIEAHPSDIDYEGTNASDVVVIEPPHLPSKPQLPFHTLCKRIVSIMKNGTRAQAFFKELNQLLERHE